MRLVRIVKVFRIRVMRDLRLMVKGPLESDISRSVALQGLIAGVRTLVLAMILLFAVLYVISGFATMTPRGGKRIGVSVASEGSAKMKRRSPGWHFERIISM